MAGNTKQFPSTGHFFQRQRLPHPQVYFPGLGVGYTPGNHPGLLALAPERGSAGQGGVVPSVDQQRAQGPCLAKSAPKFLMLQPAHSTRPLPSPLSPAPPLPPEHCLSYRESKQSFLMNHPIAFVIAFTSWAPNSPLGAPIPSSMYFPPTRGPDPIFPAVLHSASSRLLACQLTRCCIFLSHSWGEVFIHTPTQSALPSIPGRQEEPSPSSFHP